MKRRTADIEYEQMLLSRFSVAKHRQEDGLDRSVYLLMSRINERGPMTIGEMSKAFLLDASTLQRQTTVALREGLLERIPDQDGGIARKFTLSPLGMERLRNARGHSVEALERILESWPSEDVNTFAELLHKFNASIEEYRSTLHA